MKFCRIDLEKTNYESLAIGKDWNYIYDRNIDQLNDIYIRYCRYKNFDSVMPIFSNQYLDTSVDMLGYYDNNNLVAWDMIKIYDSKNAEALQFAWNYENSDLRLGIKSLTNACAIYKQRGFRYLYLGQSAKYKEQIQGYEDLGPL